MEINLVIQDVISYCNKYKIKELEKEQLTNYWSKIFILLMQLYPDKLFFNEYAKLGEEYFCYYESKKLSHKFIFLNFLGTVIFNYGRYEILTWYKIGKTLGVEVDKEIEQLIKDNQK